MIRIKIAENNPHLEELQYLLASASAGVLPGTARAMEKAAGFIQGTWREFALGRKELSGVVPLKNGSIKYAQSIRTEAIGQFSHEIYSEAKIADWIENGTEELDMKTTHPFGPRSRVSKKGVPYLIIPFRWGTPGSKKNPRVGFGNNVITAGTYRQLLKRSFDASRVTVSPANSTTMTPNARGEMVGRVQYEWGSRLRGGDFAGTIEQKTRMAGMVRFENGYDKNGKISKRYGGYFTFRVISANSPKNSWIKPATPPRHVTRAVMNETRETIEQMVDEAIEGDIANL
jgi:hypothetical protein